MMSRRRELKTKDKAENEESQLMVEQVSTSLQAIMVFLFTSVNLKLTKYIVQPIRHLINFVSQFLSP